MNYGSNGKTYSIISVYSSKEYSSKDFPTQMESDYLVIHETTPLLIRRPQNPYVREYEPIINWKVIILFLFLLLGLLIGVYLLVIEYHEQNANFRYNLIDLNTWYGDSADNSLLSNEAALHLPVTNIIVSHTRGNHCYTTKNCTAVIRGMIQNDLTDIPYNFLISGSGDCYEIRGWNYVSGFTIADIMNTSIAVGLIGNFTSNVPSENQLAELVAFINESIRRKKLSKNFNLYGIRNDSNVHEILNDMEQWSGIL